MDDLQCSSELTNQHNLCRHMDDLQWLESSSEFNTNQRNLCCPVDDLQWLDGSPMSSLISTVCAVKQMTCSSWSVAVSLLISTTCAVTWITCSGLSVSFEVVSREATLELGSDLRRHPWRVPEYNLSRTTVSNLQIENVIC